MTRDTPRTVTQRPAWQRARWAVAAEAHVAVAGEPSLRELREANQARIADERYGTNGDPGGRGRETDGRELSLPSRVFSGFLETPAA